MVRTSVAPRLISFFFLSPIFILYFSFFSSLLWHHPYALVPPLSRVSNRGTLGFFFSFFTVHMLPRRVSRGDCANERKLERDVGTTKTMKGSGWKLISHFYFTVGFGTCSRTGEISSLILSHSFHFFTLIDTCLWTFRPCLIEI